MKSTQTKSTAKDIFSRLVHDIWHNRSALLKMGGLGLLLAIIIILSTPKEYETSIFVVPESTLISSSGIAMMDFEGLGVSSGGLEIRDAILPSFYPRVISSTPFLTSLFDISVNLSEASDSTVTLYDYMANFQRRPWWSTIKSLPYKAIGKVVGVFNDKDEAVDTIANNGTVNPFWLTKREATVAQSINRRINVDVDRTRRTITLKIRMQDPVVAAIVADSVSSKLQTYITDYRIKKERNKILYLTKLNDDAYDRYEEKQLIHAQFADKHQDLYYKTSQAELLKLRIEKDIAFEEYNRLKKQLHDAMELFYKERPIYAVIEPAKVPLNPVSPNKIRVILACIALAMVLAYLWIRIRHLFSVSPVLPNKPVHREPSDNPTQ